MSKTALNLPPPPPLPQNLNFPIAFRIPTGRTKKDNDLDELELACHFGSIDCKKKFSCQYHKVTQINQEGPTCGLTALSMLLGGVPDTATLLNLAKSQKMTNNGEMFSARNLFKLTRKHMSSFASSENMLPECEIHEGPLNSTKIKNILMEGGVILVPYPF